MTVLITLTTAGTDSGPFDLYSDLDGYLSAFESGVSKSSLEAGYASSLVPDYTNIIRVKSNGVFCTNFVNITVGSTTTTTTTTSTSTTTTTTVTPPWNSLTALRKPFDTSNQNSPFVATACGYDIGAWNNLYLASQILNTVHVGDRVFTVDLPGTTTFDGTDNLGNPSYWVISLFEDIELNCPDSKRLAKIDQGGFIVELQCCQ
jgi:hypothetical protein